MSLDLERKRIGVAVDEQRSAKAGDATAAAPVSVTIAPGARLTGKVERLEKYGVFIFLAPGKTGLIPLAETGVDRESDLRKTFPIGAEVEVIVLDVETSGRRIRLSRKAVFEAEERGDAREYTERQDRQQSEGIRLAGRQTALSDSAPGRLKHQRGLFFDLDVDPRSRVRHTGEPPGEWLRGRKKASGRRKRDELHH